jgi:pimeloyl-ACP methyl ester carboxylesterase
MFDKPTSAPPLVYLPGLDGTGRLLFRQGALHQFYRVECISYPQNRPATYAQLAAMGAERLERAGRPGIVLAESFGGAVALTLALARPELVERLVLVNTFAWFPARWRIGLAAWAGQFFPPRPGHPATRGVRGRFFFGPDIPPAERAEWWERTADVPLNAYGHRLRMIAELDLRSQLRQVRVPALVLVAPNDRVVPPRAGLDLARRLPNARLVRLAAGHAAMIHPRVDIARLLADPRYGGPTSAAAAPSAGSGPG